MCTIVTFAGNLAEAPQLHYPRDIKACASRRALVNRQIQSDQSEWVNDELNALRVKILASAASHFHDSCRSGDAI